MNLVGSVRSSGGCEPQRQSLGEPRSALRLKAALVGTLPAALTAVVVQGSLQHVSWERVSMATLWDYLLEDRGQDVAF